MEDGLQFRVLLSPRESRQYPDCPRLVPWSLVEPHQRRAVRNHSQTLERLNQRGGLHPIKLYAIVHDKDWWCLEHLSEEEAMQTALAWLRSAVA